MAPKNSLLIFKRDLPAAVVVFLVALPLCLGIALASGAPLISGLIAGIVGGIVVGALSGSPVGVSGPAAGLAVIVLTAIQELGSFDVFLVAVILAGLIQVGLGFARAGIIGYYFPASVIKGMLAGIGIIIIMKQIPHALGYDKEPEGSVSFATADGGTTLSSLSEAFTLMSPGPMLIAGVSLGILILWQTRWIKSRPILSRIPGPLLAVTAGVVLAITAGSTPTLLVNGEHLVQVPVIAGLSDLGSLLTFPDFRTGLQTAAVYETAVVLAIVASLETLLCVEATDKLDPLKRITPTNRELKAQGVGNMVSGLLGGLPVTQVIVRSSANIQAGGSSRVSAIIHGFFLAIGVLLLPGVMNLIPLAALASVLLVVGYKLANPAMFRQMYKGGPAQYIPFAVTVLGIVFTDLLMGIGLGLVVAIIGLLFENYRLPITVEKDPAESDRVRLTLTQQVTFLHKASIMKMLQEVSDDSTVDIDAVESVFIHPDVVELINEFAEGSVARGVTVHVTGLDNHQKGVMASASGGH
ncbi:MAG: MFS superfamily sulfate permease-like transporter [Myxococcota bacterium]|jgi:MFS superfamily sulfate permease-like transporter